MKAVQHLLNSIYIQNFSFSLISSVQNKTTGGFFCLYIIVTHDDFAKFSLHFDSLRLIFL